MRAVFHGIRVFGSRALDRAEPLIRIIIYFSGWSSILFVAAIFFFIIKEAWPILPQVNWGEFFFENRWLPNPAEGNAPVYGAAGILYGTFAVTAVSMCIAMPLGLAAAVYISEFATGKVKETLKILVELLAARGLDSFGPGEHLHSPNAFFSASVAQMMPAVSDAFDTFIINGFLAFYPFQYPFLVLIRERVVFNLFTCSAFVDAEIMAPLMVYDFYHNSFIGHRKAYY